MRRLCRSVTGIALLAVLSGGCGGSTAHDRLVLRFLRFDNTGITQSDQVRETGADVDVLQECCTLTADLSGCATAEPFTQTSINAVFRNEQAADILLTGYTVDYGPNSGLPNRLNEEVFDGKLHGALSTNLVGGRCSTGERPCATDGDCFDAASGTNGTCSHTETTVSGILLVDFDVKLNIAVGTRNVLVTFYGSDALQSFQTSAGYVIRFDDFNNCAAGAAGKS